MNTNTIYSADIGRCYAVQRYNGSAALAALENYAADAAKGGLCAGLLPDGFPFLYRVETGLPIKPILIYLYQRWKRPKPGLEGQRSLNTTIAQAYDLCDFLEHLDACGFGYEDISQDIFDGFAENLAQIPSARTGRILSHKTVKRRLALVAGFLKSREFELMGSATIDLRCTPAGGRADGPQIHPLMQVEWERLAPLLGPLPSERLYGQSSTARLAAEWSLLSGARRFEIAQLAAPPLQAICGTALSDPEISRMHRLKVTKGGVPRTIWIHPDLIRETRIYLAGERRESLARGGLDDHGLLLVSPSMLTRHAGAPVRPDAITGWFREAARLGGLVRRLTDGEEGSHPFVFHDLRHTFAVWTYVALREAGVERPEKVVQARLGHKFLETTTRIYLDYIEDNEPEISDLLQSKYGGWDTDA